MLNWKIGENYFIVFCKRTINRRDHSLKSRQCQIPSSSITQDHQLMKMESRRMLDICQTAISYKLNKIVKWRQRIGSSVWKTKTWTQVEGLNSGKQVIEPETVLGFQRALSIWKGKVIHFKDLTIQNGKFHPNLGAKRRLQIYNQTSWLTNKVWKLNPITYSTVGYL